VNPAPAQPVDARQLGDASYFIPNETEAEVITGLAVQSIDDAKQCAAALLQQGFRKVILTLGSRGALLASPEGSDLIAPFNVTPVDTTGAGDAFIGSFAVFLGAGGAGKGSGDPREFVRGNVDDESGDAEVVCDGHGVCGGVG